MIQIRKKVCKGLLIARSKNIDEYIDWKNDSCNYEAHDIIRTTKLAIIEYIEDVQADSPRTISAIDISDAGMKFLVKNWLNDKKNLVYESDEKEFVKYFGKRIQGKRR
jgi:hypothetical protein